MCVCLCVDGEEWVCVGISVCVSTRVRSKQDSVLKPKTLLTDLLHLEPLKEQAGLNAEPPLLGIKKQPGPD